MTFSRGRIYLVAGGAALAGVAFYLIWAATATPGGFPVDDAWIHQVFARNMAHGYGFSYNPGESVAGSTSPLWTLVLVPGYIFGGEFYRWWAYLLGWLCLAGSGVEVGRLYRLLFGEERAGAAIVAVLFAVLDWRLVWAGASGMETLLFTFGCLLLVRFYLQHREDGWVYRVAVGLLGGGLLFVRPEGVALLGLVGLDMLLKFGFSQAVRRGLGILAGFAAMAVLYVGFNLLISGTPLPTTLAAKSGYYAGISRLDYLADALLQILLQGPLLVLLPGLILYIVGLITQNSKLMRPSYEGKTQNFVFLLWPLLILVLYAVQLPVTYHHARYLMPLIPFLTLYGVRGSQDLLARLRAARLPVVARLLPWVGGLVLLVALVTGAQAYTFDVKFINDEQVTVGKWLAVNTPPDSLVATHDIGAIAYFGERKLVDTAGLITPGFVGIVRNEAAILQKVQSSGVNYFALLPTWYPDINATLQGQGRKVFQPTQTYLAQYGQENMAIFKLK